jgi:hypothetical protein
MYGCMDVCMFIYMYVLYVCMYVCIHECRCVDVVNVCMKYGKLNNIGVCKST